MPVVHINGRSFSFDEILNGKFESIPDYEKQTLEFCRDWLREKNEFTLNTSGSTGTPKPITITREQMMKSSRMTAQALGLKSGFRSLVCMNTELIAGKMMLARGMEIGMEMFVITPSSNPLKEISKDTSFDFTALVPFQLETILKESPEKKNILDKMKAIIIGGATINHDLENKIQNISAPVYHTFGMTETVSHIALKRINGKEKSEYFKVLNNVSISIDSRNCLVINSSLTNEPIITNDLVEIIDDKNFKWLGRIDSVINSGGIKIHPEKLESEIGKVFYNEKIDKRFFVVGFSNAELGEAASLIIEDENWNETKKELIKNKLKENLSKYEIPKYFYFVKKFTETQSGKIDRLAIKKKLMTND